MIRKFLFPAIALALASIAFPALTQDTPKLPTKTTQSVWRPCKAHKDGGHFVHFCHLDKLRKAKPEAPRFFKAAGTVTLPIDWAKSFSFPMYLNDTYGDCYYAAGCHADNTWTANASTKSEFSLSAIQSRYFALSGGDNGLSDDDMQGEMMGRYLADVTQAKIVSWADIDPTDANACQSALADFGVVIFTLGVPNAWINNSDTGDVWDTGTGNPANGHAVIFNGCRADGAYTLQTWGTYVWITPRGVKNCLPAGWVAFSARWFNAKGYAPNGKHIVDLAKTWQAATGKAIPASVINAFPVPSPTPDPTPTPTPGPTPGNIASITVTYTDGTSVTIKPGTGGKTVPDGTPQALIDALNQVFMPKALPMKKVPGSSLEDARLNRILTLLENHQKRLDKPANMLITAESHTDKMYTDLRAEFGKTINVFYSRPEVGYGLQLQQRVKSVPAIGIYTADWMLIEASPVKNADKAIEWAASKL